MQYFHCCYPSLSMPSGVMHPTFLVKIVTVIWTTLIPSCLILEQLCVLGTLGQLQEDGWGLLTCRWFIAHLFHDASFHLLSLWHLFLVPVTYWWHKVNYGKILHLGIIVIYFTESKNYTNNFLFLFFSMGIFLWSCPNIVTQILIYITIVNPAACGYPTLHVNAVPWNKSIKK